MQASSQRFCRLVGLWLAVDKVIHHDDVVLIIIIRPRGDVAGCDPDPRDARVVKHDAEEGKAPIARRGRDETAEDQLAVEVEVLHQRAGPTGFRASCQARSHPAGQRL